MMATEAAIASGPVERPAKIAAPHLDRLAVVYVRQSTARQVLEHRESTALQYALRDRAIAWGWPEQRVLLIDEDLGHSGASVEGRAGFQRLLAEVTLDHVGLVLGIEMSRLARSCKDWHQLLELCALFGTLLADQDGLYDPRQYNDRLLLGLKGTLSEAELHILRQRMHEGRLNKARRGELFNHAPIGYLRLPAGDELVIDPDEQVQQVVRLIFAQFERLGTINAVLKHLVRHQVQIPVRPHAGSERGRLQWRRPNRQTLRNLLHHPIYAGAYTWGRRPVDPRRKVPGRPATGRTVADAEQCQVLIRDRCPAYISWDQYQANRRRLARNLTRASGPGPTRGGPALLAGLVICSRCGCRMLVQYDPCARPRYTCTRQAIDYGQPLCQGLAGPPLEALVRRQVLAALRPAALQLSLHAAEDLQRQRDEVDRHWRLRLERADYDAQRAARQFHAVEPENRLVARALEVQWEQALQAQRTLQEQHHRHQQEQSPPLTDDQRRQIHALAADIPGLWDAPTTGPDERQAIVRCLIEQVVVHAPADSNHADVTVHWAGGFVSQHRLRRPVARYEQLDDYDQLMERILQLRQQNHTAARIAHVLHREGFCPPKRRSSFNAQCVRALISRHCRGARRPRAMTAHQLGPHEWWLADLARHLHLPQPTLYSWLRRGWVRGRQLPIANGRWALWADEQELRRLGQLHHSPRTWHNLPQDTSLATAPPQPGESQKL